MVLLRWCMSVGEDGPAIANGRIAGHFAEIRRVKASPGKDGDIKGSRAYSTWEDYSREQ